jgi:hypothetical protein
MQRPADAASRLLAATGLGLILATGFGLQQQMIDLNKIGVGWVIGISGLILIAISTLVAKGDGPLAKSFPLENDIDMANRVRDDIEEIEKDSSMGNAWAKLEATVLEQDISEQE